MKVLIIGAHPDDEVLGAGGAILHHVANKDEVYVCIVTKANPDIWSDDFSKNKDEEQNKVDNYLGIKKRYNLNLPSVSLNTIAEGKLNTKINKVIDEINPDVVYTHNKDDLNYDHTLTYRASLVATRPPKKITLICYETVSETEWSYIEFQPNYWINIENFIEVKIEAFKIYKSEVKEYPHPRSGDGLKNLASKRGNEACLNYAEAFKIIRMIEK